MFVQLMFYLFVRVRSELSCETIQHYLLTMFNPMQWNQSLTHMQHEMCNNGARVASISDE